MKFSTPLTVEWMTTFLNASVKGNMNSLIQGINELHKVENGDVCFVDHPKYYTKCLESDASFIIINNADVEIPNGKTIFIVEEPFECYLKIVNHFRPFVASHQNISPNAIIGKNTIIMPNVFVGDDVVIGDDCIIHSNVSIQPYTKIGNRVIIQSNTVIGSDAFYYNSKKNRDVWYKKMLSCGNVIIENDVEIGAGCTIDRGVTASTIIGSGTKMDNMIHIGHDTTIGKNCLIAAHVVIAGVVEIKDAVTIWGQVVINKTLTIGENAVLLGKTGVVGSLEGNKTYWGTPAQDASLARRELIWIKRIPEIWEKIKNK